MCISTGDFIDDVCISTLGNVDVIREIAPRNAHLPCICGPTSSVFRIFTKAHVTEEIGHGPLETLMTSTFLSFWDPRIDPRSTASRAGWLPAVGPIADRLASEILNKSYAPREGSRTTGTTAVVILWDPKIRSRDGTREHASRRPPGPLEY